FGICTVLNPRRFEDNDVYSFAANICVGGIAKWLAENNKGAELACFFEAGHQSRPLAEKHLRMNLQHFGLTVANEVSLTFATRKTVTLLQAADLFAWQVTKYVKDKVSNARPPRKDFMSLCEVHNSHYLMYAMVDKDSTLSLSQDGKPTI